MDIMVDKILKQIERQNYCYDDQYENSHSVICEIKCPVCGLMVYFIHKNGRYVCQACSTEVEFI